MVVLGVATVVAGVVLRFYCPSALWLDETLSVNISRLPLGQIPAALRQDGSPPLYYVLLHFWMLAFGQGDFAVRALSGVTSVATIPLWWFAGRRLGGRTVAWVTFFLGVTSPFAIYYATATRMYSLMILFGLVGYLCLNRALESPSRGRLVALGLVTTGTLYTHYWGLYIVGVTGIWLLYHLWRHHRGLPERTEAVAVRRCLLAMVLGCVLFVPWAPIFVFQSLHTGTPWAGRAGPVDMLHVFSDFAGTGPWADLLAYLYFGLMVLGVFGRRVGPAARASETGAAVDGAPGPDDLRAAGIEPVGTARSFLARLRWAEDWTLGFAGFGPGGAGAGARRSQPGRGVNLVLQPNGRATPLFAVLVGTILVAIAGSYAADAAFVARYTAIVLPLFLLLIALGVGVLDRPKLVNGTLAVMCVAGLLTGLGNNSQPRTQAVQVAAVLNAEAVPGDMVLMCPDQLGPAVNRLVTVPDLTELTFPRAIAPQRVDWINYKQTIADTNVEAFAQTMVARLRPGHTLWLVWKDNYAGFGADCGDLASWLGLLKGQGANLITANSKYYESENLTRYPT